MADERHQDGICRYLKHMPYEFFQLFGKPGSRFEYDLAHIARDAMTKGAQLRMTKASFPQELRLQVMKASVQYHSSTFRVPATATSETLTKDLKDAVLAEQAFFEAAIFKVYTSDFRSREADMYSTDPDFGNIAERMQHLELRVLILPELGWEATLENATSLWASLRLRSPKLKACVFTVVVQTFHHPALNGGEIYLEYYGSHNQNPFPKDILPRELTPGQCLGNTLTKLFAEFAEKGVGARRFIRIQHFQYDALAKTATPHYGPLVAVQSARSDPMLTRGAPTEQAYLLRRTSSHVVARRSSTGFEEVISVTGNARKAGPPKHCLV